MLMRLFLSVLSIIILVGSTIPYAIDIIKGRVQPARATRIMFFGLMIVVLLQQHSLNTGYALGLTIGEAISAFILLFLARKHGVGGFRKLDIICYSILIIDLIVWLTTNNALLALHLSVLADFIAFWPTIHKTWHDNKSETALYYWAGVVAALLAIISEQNKTYHTLLFPAYLGLTNLLEVMLIYGYHQRIKK